MPSDTGQILDLLYATVAGRKGSDPEKSYTAKLFAKGRKKIAQKLGEEAVETVIAALVESPENVVGESADLLYHWLVLIAARGVTTAEVAAVLAGREGVSGHAEKASRSVTP